MNEKGFVYLNIRSWIGIGLGAQHYYGTLEARGDIDDIVLTRTLSARQAARANRYRGVLPLHRQGDVSSGFDSIDDIKALAIKTWKDLMPQGETLLLGRSSIAEPLEILAWPAHPELIDPANEVWNRFEELEGYRYRHNRDLAEAIEEEWEDIIEKGH